MWLAPASTTHYQVTGYTVAGAETLLRVLTGQPLEIVPDLGTVPYLPPRGAGTAAGARRIRPALRTQVVIEARVAEDGQVASAVWLGGSLLCQRQAPLPAEVAGVWGALRLPRWRRPSGWRMRDGGWPGAARRRRRSGRWRRRRTGCRRATPGGRAERGGPLLSLPVELIRLAASGGEVGPLGLLPGVSVCRRIAARPGTVARRRVTALPAPAGCRAR